MVRGTKQESLLTITTRVEPLGLLRKTRDARYSQRSADTTSARQVTTGTRSSPQESSENRGWDEGIRAIKISSFPAEVWPSISPR